MPALDASSPAAVGHTQNVAAKATAAFSPPADSWLYAMVGTAGDASAGFTAAITNSGTALTWSLVVRSNVFSTGALSGTTEVWRAYNRNAQAGITCTCTFNRVPTDTTPASDFRVAVITGANPDQTGAATNTQTSTVNTTMSVAVATTKANSWVWGACTDWSSATAPTAGSGQTIDSQQLNAGSADAYFTIRQNATTPAAGTSVTMSTTAPSNHLQAVAFEIIDIPVGSLIKASTPPFITPQLEVILGLIPGTPPPTITPVPVIIQNHIVQVLALIQNQFITGIIPPAAPGGPIIPIFPIPYYGKGEAVEIQETTILRLLGD